MECLARSSTALRRGRATRSTRPRAPTASNGRVKSLSTSLELPLQLAESTDRLDLSDTALTDLPAELFELTNLTELSLSGNAFVALPAQVSRLTRLQRLQLAGNELRTLPEEIGALTELKGLWVHGNFLESLPESFGELQGLQKCSLSGNRLSGLPSSLSRLTSLEELEVAGNELRELPNLEGLEKLQKLTLHGNQLSALPESILFCLQLQNLALQGNQLREIVSPYCFFPQALRSLNLADNQLQTLKCEITNLTALEQLTLYGNQLKTLPEGLMDLPKLKAIWLEGNPLEATTLQAVTAKRPIKVGLDQNQRLSSNATERSSGSMVSFSQIPSPYQKGYFKLVKDESDEQAEMLVVAFGSAPGTPNWGSVLRRVKEQSRPVKPKEKKHSFERSRLVEKAAEEKMELKFDVLFVVDPERSWYGAGGADFDRYASLLQTICQPYRHRLMIGDSMGASAALMFSNLASDVLAFCPQVDLKSASIRPATSPEAWTQLMHQMRDTVEHSQAAIKVVTGTWSHDLDQVKSLNQDRIEHCIMHVDTHRLTAYLEQSQKLVPFIASSITQNLQDSSVP